MTEVEKMRSGQLADMSAPELQLTIQHDKKQFSLMRLMSAYDQSYR